MSAALKRSVPAAPGPNAASALRQIGALRSATSYGRGGSGGSLANSRA